MKRLLAYLFIVLGLGLVFSVNSYSKAPSKYICYGKYDNLNYYIDWYNWFYGYSWWPAECKKKGNLVSKKTNPIQFSELKSKIISSGKKISTDGQHRLILKNEVFHKLFVQLGLNPGFDINKGKNNKTQIAKSALTQVKYSYDKDFLCFQNLNGTIFVGTSKGGWVTTTDNIENLCDYFIYKEHHPKIYSRLKKFEKYSTIDRKVPIADAYIRDLNKKKYSKVLHKKTLLKQTQIAKTEPSQTQDAEINIKFEMVAKVFNDNFSDTGQYTKYSIFSDTIKVKLNDKKTINNFFKKVHNKTLKKCKKKNLNWSDDRCKVTAIKYIDLNNSKDNKTLVNKNGFSFEASFDDVLNDKTTQIVQKELSQTQKVASVENKKYLNIKFCEKTDHKTTQNRILDRQYLGYFLPMIESGVNCPIGFKTHKNNKYYLKLIKFFKKEDSIVEPGGTSFTNMSSPMLCYSSKLNSVKVVDNVGIVCESENSKIFHEVKYDGSKLYIERDKTQIAKTEPSQTQEAAKTKINLSFCQLKSDKFPVLSKKFRTHCRKHNGKLITYQRFLQDPLLAEKNICFNTKTKIVRSTRGSCRKDMGYSKVFYENGSFYYSKTQTKIAKAEELTQEEIKELLDKYGKPAGTEEWLGDLLNTDVDKDPPVIEIAEEKSFNESYYELEGKVSDKAKDIFVEIDGNLTKVNKGKFTVKGYSPTDKEISIVAIDGHGNKSKPKVVKIIIDIEDTDIAKKSKEEFKPETGDIDNDPPVIEIAEAITVDSQAYTLKGKVKDKSKIYLTIDGRQVQVKKGKFEFEGFAIDPEEGEVLKIVAIDRWRNRSEKDVKIIVELKETTVARTFEKLKPNSVRVKTDKNKIAIIIGAENYRNMTKCNYCNNDANAFRAYAKEALGVKKSNTIVLIDEDATRGQILKTFKIDLRKIAGEGGKDIHVFFAGHGLASESGDDVYLIPQDGDESLLEDTAISRVELIKLIQEVNPKSVTMFIDACYSGQTRNEKVLVASLRGLKKTKEEDIPNNFTIFTASSSNQGSSHIEEAKHGIFSYYLMKGLEGKADSNKDKKITNGELFIYLKTNVSKEAFVQDRDQDPMLSGVHDKILISYR